MQEAGFSDPGTQLSLFNEISAQKKTAQTSGGLERTLPSIADVVAPSTLNKSGPITTEPAKTELAKTEPVIPVIPPASKAPTATEVVSSVTAEINRWRDAWQNKQVEQYFAQYVDGFSGDFPSAKQWRKQRQTKILAGKNIRITLLDLKVMPVDSTRVNVSFIQQYQSGTYKDSGTKTLTLKKVQERWLIEHELFSTAKEAAAETPTVAPSLTTLPMAAVAQPPVVETKVTPAASPKISPTLSAHVPPTAPALTAAEITANVTAEINDWRDSWQNKQVEQYLAHYVEGFSGDLGNARCGASNGRPKLPLARVSGSPCWI